MDIDHQKNVSEMVPIFLKLDPQDIVYLKAILESYDELGVLRTLNQNTGEVVILSLPDLKPDLDKLLESLRAEMDFIIVEGGYAERPLGDWLIEEDMIGKALLEASRKV